MDLPKIVKQISSKQNAHWYKHGVYYPEYSASSCTGQSGYGNGIKRSISVKVVVKWQLTMSSDIAHVVPYALLKLLFIKTEQA